MGGANTMNTTSADWEAAHADLSRAMHTLFDERDTLFRNLSGVTAERDAIINAAIVETAAVCVWHIGYKGGHEPTRELARVAVRRAAGISGKEQPSATPTPPKFFIGNLVWSSDGRPCIVEYVSWTEVGDRSGWAVGVADINDPENISLGYEEYYRPRVAGEPSPGSLWNQRSLSGL
jgi:hypothetical protein